MGGKEPLKTDLSLSESAQQLHPVLGREYGKIEISEAVSGKMHALIQANDESHGGCHHCTGKYIGNGSGHGCPKVGKGNYENDGNDGDNGISGAGKLFHGFYLLM